MQYKSQKDYEQKHKVRSKWSNQNDYDVFNNALCLECAFFKMDIDLPICGACKLMEQEGAYNGVLAQAVCNRFLSHKGTDINGKQLDPAVLSIAFKIERLGNGEIYIPHN